MRGGQNLALHVPYGPLRPPLAEVVPLSGHGPTAHFEDEFPVRQFVILTVVGVVRLADGELRSPPMRPARHLPSPRSNLWRTLRQWLVEAPSARCATGADPALLSARCCRSYGVRNPGGRRLTGSMRVLARAIDEGAL